MHTAIFLLAGVVALQGAGTSTAPQTRKPAQAARPSMTVTVTDLDGKTLPDVWVKASGPVDREAATDASGMVTFRNMTPGTYRLRFEHDDFVTLEREVTQGARALAVTIALNAAPPKPAPPAPAEAAPPPDPALPPSGPPTYVSIPDFFEKNFVGNAPSLVSLVGCAPSATTHLLQLRAPLEQHVHVTSDEMLYVVAGEGIHKIAGREIPLDAGLFAVVPRGTAHSIVRRGSRPVIVLSIMSGEPCVPK
jgi:mannose-6-phosphate isomerase-like protein (cupin superfamily)